MGKTISHSLSSKLGFPLEKIQFSNTRTYADAQAELLHLHTTPILVIPTSFRHQDMERFFVFTFFLTVHPYLMSHFNQIYSVISFLQGEFKSVGILLLKAETNSFLLVLVLAK